MGKRGSPLFALDEDDPARFAANAPQWRASLFKIACGNKFSCVRLFPAFSNPQNFLGVVLFANDINSLNSICAQILFWIQIDAMQNKIGKHRKSMSYHL
jgi:hypothetical protein